MLIDRSFFVDWRVSRNNLRYVIGIFTVGFHIVAQNYGFAAKLPGHFHRHAGVYAKISGFITAAGYYPPVRNTPDNNGFGMQLRVAQALDRYKKGIQI